MFPKLWLKAFQSKLSINQTQLNPKHSKSVQNLGNCWDKTMKETLN